MAQILYITVKQDHYQAKYKSQIEAWRNLGYKCEHIDIKDHTDMANLRKSIQQADLIYLRQEASLIKKWLYIRKLIKNKKYLVEIPTPLHIYFNEIRTANKHSTVKTKLITMLAKVVIKDILNNSQLIIEFAEDHEKLIKKHQPKIFLWQNGLNNTDLYQLEESYFQNQLATIKQFNEIETLNLIMVAQLANYHGADRVIRGIYNYKRSSNEYKIIFNIISPKNIEVLKIIKLIQELNLEENIKIINYIPMSELQHQYEQANIAIGPIGSSRKNLTSASSLKVRESTFFGLPIIIDHFDYDLTDKEFTLQVPSNNDPIDIQRLIQFYSNLIEANYNPISISQYAAKNLTWNNKISHLSFELNKRAIIL